MSEQPPTARESVDLLIEGGVVVTLDRERRVLADGAIAVQGDTIAAIGPRLEIVARYQGARTLDARRHLVRPGYVDAHVHVTAETLTRGFFPDWVGQRVWVREWATPLYGAIQPHEEYVAALLSATELLRNGTTTFCEGGSVLDVGQVARAVAESGLRATLARWTWDRVPRPASLYLDTDAAIATTEALIDTHHGSHDGRLRVMANVINAETASERLLHALNDLAQRRGLLLNLHQSPYRAYGPEALAAWGVKPIVHLRDLGLLGPHLRLIHMNHLDPDECELLCATDTRIVHCPGTALRLAYGASRAGRFVELLADGVTVGLGTDGANAGDQLDMSRAIYLAAGIHKDGREDSHAMPAETVLEMATRHGARTMAWEDEIGSLEVGKKADIVLLRRDRPEMVPLVNAANALVYAADGRAVDTVLVGGRVVVERGRVLTIDEPALFREAEALAPRLIARSGLPLDRRWPVIGELPSLENAE